MRTRISLLVAGAVVLLVVATASATSRTASVPEPAAAPFAPAWALTPRTPAGREARSFVVVALEDALPGTLNTNFEASNTSGTVEVVAPVLTPIYAVDQKYEYIPDLVSKVTATKKALTFDIRPEAVWNWGGKSYPVTYRDFVYTWKAILSPKDSVVSTAGMNQLGSWTHKGLKQVTFYWKTRHCTANAPCGPYADYRDLFGFVYPSFALKGMNFNSLWTKCVCGSNGKFVSDGPYYLSNYTRGEGVTLKENPLWWGSKPHLKEIDFKVITNVDAEIQAIRGGEVDVASPSPETALSTLIGVKGLTYKIATGLYNEHIDLQEGPSAKDPRVPLLRAPWFRQAIMLGLDRKGLVNALYGKIAPGLPVMNNLVFFPSDANYRPDFAKWNYSPQKAISLLKAHGCTGGPDTPSASNSKVWTCAGYPAQLAYMAMSDNPARVTAESIFQANLQAIGIKVTADLLPAATMFDAQHVVSGNYDVVQFSWGGVLDPGAGNQVWACNGSQNFLHYCDDKVTKLLDETNTQLDPVKRDREFQAADRLMASEVPSIPLYDEPNVVTYRSNIRGVTNTATGITWNVQDWRWSS
jgi:peptide/nickel transport system substrate-binding protein